MDQPDVPAEECADCDEDAAQASPALVNAYTTLLREIGEDPSREGLLKTPQRAAKALRFLTSGYTRELRDVVGNAKFRIDGPTAAPSTSSGMVVVRDIELHSLCEHHLLPFYGRAHVAYLPGAVVLGLSKVARITDLYARRLQIQERLTQQIAAALMSEVQPRGVAVVVECFHMCMAMRGVEQRAVCRRLGLGTRGRHGDARRDGASERGRGAGCDRGRGMAW